MNILKYFEENNQQNQHLYRILTTPDSAQLNQHLRLTTSTNNPDTDQFNQQQDQHTTPP